MTRSLPRSADPGFGRARNLKTSSRACVPEARGAHSAQPVRRRSASRASLFSSSSCCCCCCCYCCTEGVRLRDRASDMSEQTTSAFTSSAQRPHTPPSCVSHLCHSSRVWRTSARSGSKITTTPRSRPASRSALCSAAIIFIAVTVLPNAHGASSSARGQLRFTWPHAQPSLGLSRAHNAACRRVARTPVGVASSARLSRSRQPATSRSSATMRLTARSCTAFSVRMPCACHSPSLVGTTCVHCGSASGSVRAQPRASSASTTRRARSSVAPPVGRPASSSPSLAGAPTASLGCTESTCRTCSSESRVPSAPPASRAS
mmetsp:Transcript_38095/g.94506  ORF Transcript_38095/g.94506 Transcript_38095/m.94506 type:complete len:318 (+) Transcript_38095:1263-2216(+)